MERTREEIEAVKEKCYSFMDDGRSGVPGMTYEEGVEAALRWALGDSDDDPMEHADEEVGGDEEA
jgi:hypothetical protein